jgi:anti-anti-sigma factor
VDRTTGRWIGIARHPCQNPRRVRDEVTFAVELTADPDGFSRLTLVGELDHLASEELLRRLQEPRVAGQPIRLDLSRLEFIDSSGVRAILVSLRESRGDGGRLEIDPQVSWQVQRVFDVLGIRDVLWPQEEATG